jgi:hypothetical protein
MPRNSRSGLGRGVGSQSESPPGALDYVEALASQARQGRSMDLVVLTLFMAGVLQPENCPAADPLMQTYEAAVRQAFRTQIDRGDLALVQVLARATASDKDALTAEDQAFAEAEAAANRRVTRTRLRLERLAADLGGTQPRTRDEMKREDEQALLSAAGLRPLWFDHDEGDRDFEDIWHTGLPPIDLDIFAKPPCEACSSRTAHMPTSPQGRHDILNSACICQLNRARAIGGAICMLVANLRDAALQDPGDQFLRDAVTLCANTSFRFLLREHRKVAPWRPETIVPCTLFFLQDCRWLRAAAALLTQIALWRMPTAEGDASIPAAAARAMSQTLRRGAVLRLSENSAGMLLSIDGIVQAAELLKPISSHPA